MKPVWHVLSLPADADWRWVEAARLYVERFRVLWAWDPEQAVALPGDPLLLSLILPDGRPGHTAAWLCRRRPSILLGVLFAPTPEHLQRIPDARAAQGDRLGRGLRVVTTDRLNVRSGPSRSAPIIGRLEAGMESVYAAADGWVLQAGERLEHPYGAQVRVQHRRPDGVYITVYGCLMPGSPVARAGEFVRAGQALGRAGSDGFVHFMLRKEEARNGPYGDILDPSPHLRIAP